MQKTRRFLIVALTLASTAAFTLLAGCENTDTADNPAPPVVAGEHDHHDGHGHAAHMQDAADQATAAADQAVADAAAQVQTIQQEKCPIMNAPINEEIYTVYQGKKVYFCCAGCDDTFNKNPEKYLSKLPQFNEQE